MYIIEINQNLYKAKTGNTKSIKDAERYVTFVQAQRVIDKSTEYNNANPVWVDEVSLTIKRD